MHNQLQLLDYSWVGRMPGAKNFWFKPVQSNVRFYYNSFACEILFYCISINYKVGIAFETIIVT